MAKRRELTEERKFEDRIGGGLARGLNKVVAAIGYDAARDEFTRRQLRDAKFTSVHGLRRFAKLLMDSELSPKPKNLRHLIKHHTFNEILDLGGIGVWTADALGEACFLKRINPNPWLDESLAEDEKIAAASRRARAKRKKGKSRR